MDAAILNLHVREIASVLGKFSSTSGDSPWKPISAEQDGGRHVGFVYIYILIIAHLCQLLFKYYFENLKEEAMSSSPVIFQSPRTPRSPSRDKQNASVFQLSGDEKISDRRKRSVALIEEQV